jgi:hypothetical protein
MAISQPSSSDKLNNPSHSTLHKIIASDVDAPVKTIVVDADGNTKIGDTEGGNYTEISSSGVTSLLGDAKRSLTLRPQLDSTNIIKTIGEWSLVPTPFTLGAFSGFFMPAYNNDNQELFFRMRAPYRWDGTTNPTFKMIVALSATEDVGDKFKFQLDWNTVSPVPTDLMLTPKIETDVVTVVDEVIVLEDRNTQYSAYPVSFELDIDNAGLQQQLEPRNNLVGRIRRITSGSPAVSNNIIILDWVTNWKVNKNFGNF